MKNVSSLKSKNNIESPKTPGGISKSLLTPCRRVGLSRNWRKSGPSPFISPLSSCNSTPEDKSNSESRKRKKLSPEKEIESENNDENFEILTTPPDLVTQINENLGTPKRNTLQRKKSKTLHLVEENLITKNNNYTTSDPEDNDKSQRVILKKEKFASKLSRQSSKNKIMQDKLPDDLNIEKCDDSVPKSVENSDNRQISPNNLTKECFVIIQNKINKNVNKKQIIQNNLNNATAEMDGTTQANFDSDSDDVPLCQLNKSEDKNNKLDKNQCTQETDLIKIIGTDKKECKDIFVKKLEDKKTSTGDIHVSRSKSKLSTKKAKNTKVEILKPITQVSNFDDNEDDEFETKKTILLRKTYDKVSKPLKARSTGSITEQDLEEIKARIEVKKKLLLAKAINPETDELRGLIKKWQKGCQEALMELVDLMKRRMPDQNMSNSEILHMLKIPPDLVGYNSDDDCFITPDDATIVWSSLNI